MDHQYISNQNFKFSHIATAIPSTLDVSICRFAFILTYAEEDASLQKCKFYRAMCVKNNFVIENISCCDVKCKMHSNCDVVP